ncbi:hypothetical protein [Mesorhizobium sp. NFR06]|uniref:hypothetical protein n=1 Tax=Mesorhizobium sp. NFR06 TaxID=1566290 RepID=UPI00122C7DF9|nr:hypothetical protein [Mesorhizobium sp. NFR06]
MLRSWSGSVRFEAGLSRRATEKSIAKTTASVALRKPDGNPSRQGDDDALKYRPRPKEHDNHLMSFVAPPWRAPGLLADLLTL